MRHRGFALIGAVVLLVPVLVAVSNTDAWIVIAVRGTTAWRVGQRLLPSTKVALGRDDEIRLLGTDDRIIAVRGPYRGKVPAKKNSLVARLYAIVAAALQPELIVIPRGSGETRAGTAAVIDLMTNGDKCFQRPDRLILWKPKADTSETAILSVSGTERARALTWNAGQEEIPWPAQWPVQSDVTYVVDFHSLGSRSFRLHFLSAPIKSDKELAAWMLSQQCFEQTLDVFASTPVDGVITARH